MGVNTPLAFYNIASTVLECIRSRIEAAGLPDFQRVCVIPGEVAWDDCSCGQLTITNPSQYGSVSFPFPTDGTRDTQCGAPYQVSTFEVTALRCAPNPDRNGHPPKCSTLDAAAKLLYQDKYYMRIAAQCCLSQMRDENFIEDFTFLTMNEVGPRGGCVGATMTFSVSLISNCPCE